MYHESNHFIGYSNRLSIDINCIKGLLFLQDLLDILLKSDPFLIHEYRLLYELKYCFFFESKLICGKKFIEFTTFKKCSAHKK